MPNPEPPDDVERDVRAFIDDVGEWAARGALDGLERGLDDDDSGRGFVEGETQRYERDGIGPFRLLETIGEGGMGIVYLAEQTAPVRRRVALKLIKPGMDSRTLVARFESERQALALMEHRGIAKVYEAGTTDRGHPYFVMEYIPGVELLEYCDTKRLTVDDRLRVFSDVCRAVQHAHQKGIIHRDLKPSNVLVVEEAGPEPKIIDFGLAKALGQRLTDKTLHTRAGNAIGTLDYMSPEQAGLTVVDVDTRSDIYSLGVILYRLLTFSHPLDEQTFRDSPVDEIRRMIREVDAPRPSSRVRSDPELAQRAAERRRTTPRGLARRLKGDLDWIVLKALEKDRARRYQSASELIADIDRFLRDEPVLAGAPSTLHQLRKFVQRNKGLVASVCVVLLLLIVGLTIITKLWIDAENARRDAVENARESAALHDYLVDVLLYGVRDQFERSHLTFTELVREAAGRLGDRFEGEPALAASIHDLLGQVFQSADERGEALAHYREALRLIDRTGVAASPHAPPRLDLLMRLGTLLDDDGDQDQALALYAEAEELTRARGRKGHPDLWLVRAQKGRALRRCGRLPQAEVELESILAAQAVPPSPWKPSAYTAATELALTKAALGRDEEAENLFRSVLDALVSSASLKRREAIVRKDYGEFLAARGRLDEAEDQLRRAYAIFERALRAHHILTRQCAATLASFFDARRRPDEAAAWRARSVVTPAAPSPSAGSPSSAPGSPERPTGD